MLQYGLYFVFMISILFQFVRFAHCANWGQVSGLIKQTLAIPYQPSLSNSHWSPRWGFSVINANVRETGDGAEGRIYLMGGDSWEGIIEGVTQNTGTQYLNDIWYTSGSSWKVVKDDLTKQARTYSDMTWSFVSTSNLLPPPNTNYDSWIACQTPISSRFEELTDAEKSHTRYPSECTEENLLKATQWSPRRNFATVNFKTRDLASNDIKEYIFLIGGRSRRLHDIERDRAVGGLQSSQIGGLRTVKAPDDVYRFASSYSSSNNWRETSILTNDVWRWDVSNHSESSVWELISPGCDSHSSQMDVLIKFGLSRQVGNRFASGHDNKYTTGKAGTGDCEDYLDCYGNEACLYPSIDSTTFGNYDSLDELKRSFGKSCVCQMFQPRESHAAYATSKNIIVLGGLTSVRQGRCGNFECGDTDGSSHSVFMNDIWKTSLTVTTTACDDDDDDDCAPPSSFSDTKVVVGENWEQVTLNAPWVGRAGHSVVLDYQSNTVWLMGGYRLRQLDRIEMKLKNAAFEREYMNDVWYCTDPDDPVDWIQLSPAKVPWSPRAFFSISMEPNSTMTSGRRLIHLYGGEGRPLSAEHTAGTREILTRFIEPEVVINTQQQEEEEEQNKIPLDGVYTNVAILGDGWSWDLPLSSDSFHQENAVPWRLDFSSMEHYRRGAGDRFYFGDGYFSQPADPDNATLVPSEFSEITGPPFMYYVGPDDDITGLRQFWLPDDPTKKAIGTRPELRQYLTSDREAMLRSVGINTIRQFADANKYQILRLRGEDFPQVLPEDRMTFLDVCDFYQLSVDIVEKCSYDSSTSRKTAFANGEARYPRNAKLVFLRGPPSTETMPAWHGRDYTSESEALAVSGDLEFQVENWDGCGKPVATWNPSTLINVNGIGYVGVVTGIRKSTTEIQELHCRVTPGDRAYHKSTFFQQKLYVFGGKDETEFKQDSWYRDDRFPTSSFIQVPTSDTDEFLFVVSCDEDGCLYEYRIWDPSTLREILPWTRVRRRFSIAWMDSRLGGPGTGNYIIFIRAIDPSGNFDEVFELDRNVYKWRYVDPIPWDIIGGAIGGFFAFLLLVYFEFKRRARKAALERYAMKRMRRKFKAARNKDAIAAGDAGKTVDWRTVYTELGDGDEDELVASGSRKKKTKKTIDDDDDDNDEEDKVQNGVEENKEMDAKKLLKTRKEQDKQRAKLGKTSEWNQRRDRIERQKEKDKNRIDEYQSTAGHYARNANDKDPTRRRIKPNSVVPVGENVKSADKRKIKSAKVSPESIDDKTKTKTV